MPRYGARAPLVVGPLVAAAGYGLFVLPGIGGSYWTTFFPAVAVLGIGMAISVAPLTTAVMGAVDSARAGVASGVNNAVSRTGGLLAVAILGVVILGAFGYGLDRRLSGLELTDDTRAALAAERINLAAAAVPADLGGEARTTVERAIAQAFVGGFRVVMVLAAALAVLGAVAAFVLIDGRPRAST